MLLLCIKIFLVRIVDVSLGAFCTIAMVKNKPYRASIIGFFEILVWFLIAREALNTAENSIWIAISYALGFAAGTFIGTVISNRFINGKLSVQVILDKENNKIIEALREKGYAVSVMDIKGHDEKHEKVMLFIEIDNNQLNDLSHTIKKYDPKAFVVVNETKYVLNGYFKNN